MSTLNLEQARRIITRAEKQNPSAALTTCQTQNYLRIVQRYLRMMQNFAMLHYSLLQRAPPENNCVWTQLRWPLRSNCCPAVQFDGGPTLPDCRLPELRRHHRATAGQAQTRTYPRQRSSTGSRVHCFLFIRNWHLRRVKGR
jgi:hypothetical protein